MREQQVEAPLAKLRHRYLIRFVTTRTQHYYLVRQATHNGKTRTEVVAFAPHAGDSVGIESRSVSAIMLSSDHSRAVATSMLASDLVREVCRDPVDAAR